MTKLLLDTHAWIWFVNGDKHLPAKICKAVNEAVSAGEVYLAAISTWELSMLAAKRKLTLNMPALEWLKDATKALRANVLPLSAEVAAESCQLPGDFHADPADRLIVATARVHHLNLVTKDQRIIEYAKQNYVKVLAF